MVNRVVLVLSLFFATAALAQDVNPVRNVSGTAGNPGAGMPWGISPWGNWTLIHGLDVHATYVSESGPKVQRNEVFSTNWFAAGLLRDFGGRGFLLLRGRVSLEPYTLPKDNGYPQMLQYISAESGGPSADRMRAHDLLGEAALHVGWKPTASTLLHAYVAEVGDPALGAPPYALRSSSVDFAEAPYAYDIQESFHDSTKVITAGFTSRLFAIEGSVFHDAITADPHTHIDSGDIDSKSARLTLTPSQNMAIQVSRGDLGKDALKRKVTSASVSYGGAMAAVTALWTRRENASHATQTAYGFEATLRGARHTLMGRAEWVDRPLGFPDVVPPEIAGATEQTTHFAVGYIFDILAGQHYRTGVGVNIDYHTQSHELPSRYGHKPQAIYLFVRFRSR